MLTRRAALFGAVAALPLLPAAAQDNHGAVVWAYIERVLNDHDLAAIDTLIAPDYVSHGQDHAPGRDALKLRRELADAQIAQLVPDAAWRVDALVAEGAHVAVRMALTGTSAAGRVVEIPAMAFYRVADRLIAEEWAIVDAETAARQLT